MELTNVSGRGEERMMMGELRKTREIKEETPPEGRMDGKKERVADPPDTLVSYRV